MTRISALALVLLALLGGGSVASGTEDGLWALRYGARGNLLVPYDPVMIVPSGPAIGMGRFGHAWSVSPDRSRLVAAVGWQQTKGQPAALRFVDLATGRIEGTLSLPGEPRRVAATAWVGGRVLALVEGGGAATVYAIDPDRRLLRSRVEIPGGVVVGERAPNALVLLLASPGTIGPATVAVVDRSARVRSILLDRISVGMTVTGSGEERRTTVRRPALALAPSGARAYVLGAGEPVAALDLRTLAVRYATLRTTAAVVKRGEGSIRSATSLPDGRIVLSSLDLAAPGSASVELVEPADWSSRVLDRTSPWFRAGGGDVFLHGERGTGLRIRTRSGAVRELFPGRSVGHVHVVGQRALVTFLGRREQAAVVDLTTWRVVRQAVPAHPLVGTGQSIVGIG